MNWYFEALKKYAVFSGRARRKEYWSFVLFNCMIGFMLGFIEAIIAPSGDGIVLPTLYSLAVLIPGIAVAIRRLHDTGRSGWWLLISLVPLIGPIVFLIFMVEDSQRGENQYGPSPKTPEERIHDVWECAACGRYLTYRDSECPRCGSTLRKHRAAQTSAPQWMGRPSGTGGLGARKNLWIVVSIIVTTLLLVGGAKVREKRMRQEQLAELRELQRWWKIERYLEDMVRYQQRYGQYLEDKLEGRFAVEPLKPMPPILY